MPLETFKAYMTICKENGTTPTWIGLRNYAQKKRMDPQPKLRAHSQDRATNPTEILSHAK